MKPWQYEVYPPTHTLNVTVYHDRNIIEAIFYDLSEEIIIERKQFTPSEIKKNGSLFI